jgi:hypothetical protein
MIIGKLRSGVFLRGLIAFMAVVFLNGVVDPPDLYSDAVAEDLSYNEMESVLEVFVECVLQYEDFFKEYDDDDAGKTLLKKYTSLDVFLFSDSLTMAFPDQCTSNQWALIRVQPPKDIWQTPPTHPPDFPA